MQHYLIATVILTLLSIIYLKIADYFGIIDNPNERSSHIVPTIRGGGVLFLFALLIFFFMSDFQYPYLVIGVTLIAFVSFIDDIKSLSVKLRLPFQFLAVLLALLQANLPFTPFYIFTILLIVGVGFINLYNFMDGINGITGGYSLGVLFGIYLVNTETEILNPDLIVYLFISIIVFGFYNFRKKARFFAGDIGSISIALILFFMIFNLMYQLMAPVLVLLIAVYGVDSCLTIAYRKVLGEQIMQPHRLHMYQKIVDKLNTPHLLVAFGYSFFQFLIGLVVYQTYHLSVWTQVIIVFLVLLLVTLTYVFFFFETKKEK